MDSSAQSQGKGAGGAGSNSSANSSSATPQLPQRSPSQSSLHRSGHASSHRHSFAENLRNPPPSPRSQRHLSFTQQAIQDLVNHPPPNRQANPRFTGRDWRDVCVGELVSMDAVKWADMDTSVEEATMTLLKGNNTSADVVLIRDAANTDTATSTFDFNDLNAYLLAVVGLAKPDDELVSLFDSLAKRAQERVAIPLRDIQPICRKETMVKLGSDRDLTQAIEIFGSGIHRILVTSTSSQVVGVLSQLRVLEFFWNEGINFPTIDRLYPVPMRDLHIGSQQIIAINADSPLADALTLMHNEGLTSVAVVDNGLNVAGNISTADVRHLTSAASLPLLQSSCMHFISVILSERGVESGRDSFPVFYVNPYSTLASTVAKLVATNSHRLWVVEPASPSPSAPATPLLGPVSMAASTSATSTSISGSTINLTSTTTGDTTILVPTASTGSAPQSPLPLPVGVTPPGFASVPAAALPGAHLSGRLTGVVSLTDILNLFAKSSGLHPADPGEQRARRRRSSSSSVRPSLDGSRASVDARRS